MPDTPTMPAGAARTFPWLNFAQFSGALNDNLYKYFAVLSLIHSGALGKDSANYVAGFVFTLPFLLFSEIGGALADRFSKATNIRVLKLVEVGVAALGVAALFSGHPAAILAVLFLLASHSALFAPNKYGIIPELVPVTDLSRANSQIQGMTYIAIIIGTVLAPQLGKWSGGRYGVAAWACVAVALAGYAASRGVARTPALGVRRPVGFRMVTDHFRTMWSIRHDRHLFLSIAGVAYFLFFGAYVQMNVIAYGYHRLGLSEEDSVLLFIPAALGIGAGSAAAARLSRRNIEFGIVPVGALGMALCTGLLAAVGQGAVIAAGACLFGLGFFGGLFNVPLTAFIQWRVKPGERGRVLAADSFFCWVGALLAALLLFLNSAVFGIGAAGGYLVLALLTVALGVVAVRLLPDFLTRFAGMLLIRCFYRLRVLHPERLPAEGGALLVANHVSWMDAILIAATTPRRIRFIMWKGMFNRWKWPQPLFRLMDTILIDKDDPPKQIVASLQQARRELDEGFLVCIFGEGMISRNGMMTSFKKGMEKILRGSTHPVVPVYLGGVWGSIFSYHGGRILGRRPSRVPYPVTVVFGEPMPANTTAFQTQQRVAELSVEHADDLGRARGTLGEAFVRSARAHWSAPALADSSGKSLTFGRALAGALALRARLEEPVGADARFGIWRPSGVGGALANLAVTLSGRVPVNLNYTASAGALRSAAATAGLRVVVSSRAFEEKAGACPVGEIRLFLEDLLPSVTAAMKAAAWLRARLLPARLVARARGLGPEDEATVLFSSGSTSAPKGVVLSHHAIQSNLESFRAVHQPAGDECICAALPFFHAFGFTCTLWYPLLTGFPAVYHPNPLEAASIGDLVERHRATISVATPSFLLAWLRKVKPEQLRSLRLLVTGAERLKPALADAFEERFGIRPLEGYGATELGPVVSVNVPDRTVDTVFQAGRRAGTVGHPLPHVAVRVVDPATGAELGPGERGMLLVRSPARMSGYLGQPEKTAEALRDGWYVTGDIGSMDEEGFVTILDRLARFSKIAGEMVPHTAVEEALHRMIGAGAGVFAVTSLPDERKGERLAVLHTAEAGDLSRLAEQLRGLDLPNLWKPDPRAFVPVDALPLLGTGKLDLQRVKSVAAERLGAGN